MIARAVRSTPGYSLKGAFSYARDSRERPPWGVGAMAQGGGYNAAIYLGLESALKIGEREVGRTTTSSRSGDVNAPLLTSGTEGSAKPTYLAYDKAGQALVNAETGKGLDVTA